MSGPIRSSCQWFPRPERTGSCTGSLATLLWRRVLHERGSGPSLGEFTRLGLLTVPAGIAAAVLVPVPGFLMGD